MNERIYYPDYAREPENYWDKCDPEFAHLTLGKRITSEQELYAEWEEHVVPHLRLGGTLVDYGCGGGWLGKFLLKNRLIKRYIGIDFSTRSLEFARKNLRDFGDKCRFQDFFRHEPATPQPLELTCLNVLHHVPSIERLLSMRAHLSIHAERLIVTIRDKNGTTFFQPTNPGNALWTTAQYMAGLFAADFALVRSSAIHPENRRQYLYFRSLA